MPLNATLLHGLAIWRWYVPPLFDAVLVHETLHRIQHPSFLLSALLLWWALFRRRDYGVATAHLFAAMLHTSVLGALMALAPRSLSSVDSLSVFAISYGVLANLRNAGYDRVAEIDSALGTDPIVPVGRDVRYTQRFER